MLKTMLKATVFASTLALSSGAFHSAAFAEVVYNRGSAAEPETVDPHKTSTVYEAHVLRDLFDGLVMQDAKADLIPGAAESWTISDDGKTYTFKLRKDAVWSDGSPVTADDFVYAFHRLEDPATGAEYASMLYPVVKAEDVNKGKAKPEEMGIKATDPRSQAQCADALLPRNADPPGRLSGQQGFDREARRGMGEAGQAGFQRRLYARRMGAERPHQDGQEPEIPRCGQRQDRCGQLHPHRRPFFGDEALRSR
jgi:hypothetical protein